MSALVPLASIVVGIVVYHEPASGTAHQPIDCGMRPHRHRLSDLIDRHNRHLELETERTAMPQFSFGLPVGPSAIRLLCGGYSGCHEEYRSNSTWALVLHGAGGDQE